MSWMRTESACAGEARTTVDAAEQTAATVSAARRADGLVGNGSLRGRVVCRDEGGARTARAAPAGGSTHGEDRRVRGGPRASGEQLSADFYARQSPAWPRHLSRFRPCTSVDGKRKRAAWVEIRLG